MTTFSALSSLGKPQAATQPSLPLFTAGVRKQPSPEALQLKTGLKQDVFFSGESEKSVTKKSPKKERQTTLVLDKNGLSYTPKEKSPWQKRLDKLIAQGANLDEPSSPFEKPILHNIAYDGDIKALIQALNYGAKVNKVDNQGCIPLHWASRAGHEEVVNELLASGAKVNAKDMNGNTSIQEARRFSHPNVVAILKNYGAED